MPYKSTKMAHNSFDIVELYRKVFNVEGVRFVIPEGNLPEEAPIQAGNFDVDQPASRLLGTPILEQVTFWEGDRSYTLPGWPLIEISASKNIVTTQVHGMNGTVKEYINIGDYQVTISGAVISDDTQLYPEEEVQELHRQFLRNESIRVTSTVFQLLNIDNLVIKDLSLPKVEGIYHWQPFTLTCLSDRPVELEIREIQQSITKT
jgi:hypothetical protein